jgi:DsbC/DsbD-like thiol-disulfide interchange protein
MQRHLIALILAIAPLPALGGETPWQEIGPDARIRLISSDRQDSNSVTFVGLEIDMAADTKTYWRVPGETGIPTLIDLAGSRGIASGEIVWPMPTLETSSGYIDYVYYGHTVLPVSLALEGAPAMLELSVIMGVCSDICVPVSADFSLALDFSRTDLAQSLRIDQALAEAPLPWSGPELVEDVRFDAEGGTLSVLATVPSYDFSGMIADTGIPSILFAPPQKSQIEGLWTFALLGRLPPEGLRGLMVRLSFRTPDGPFEIIRQITTDEPEF